MHMHESDWVALAPKRNAESLRRHLRSRGLMDIRRKITVRDDLVLIPVVTNDVQDLNEFDAEIRHQIGMAELTARIAPFGLIAESVDLEPSLKPFLPRKWERVGDVLILKLPPELKELRSVVAEAYANVLGASAVLQDIAGIAGDWRLPGVEKIWGGSTETTHLEGGVLFRLDAAKVMFSSGNSPERMKMGRVSRREETVVDMFAGIGYFTIPMAVHSRPKRIFACEVNPVAFRYLEDNIRINRVENVEPLLGDCRVTAPEGVADRIVMGYLRGQDYLDKAFRVLKPEGTIHYHEACPNELVESRPWSAVRLAARKAGRRVQLLQLRHLKSYAPGVSHVVADAKITP